MDEFRLYINAYVSKEGAFKALREDEDEEKDIQNL